MEMLKNRKIRQLVMIWILLLAGMLCFVYFMMLVTYVGPQTFFFVFPLLGVGCFLLALLWHGHNRGKIRLPRKLIIAFWALTGTGAVLLSVLFGMILYGQSVGPEKKCGLCGGTWCRTAWRASVACAAKPHQCGGGVFAFQSGL